MVSSEVSWKLPISRQWLLLIFLTLKDMGFLVSQIYGGGLIQSILEKGSVTPPNFILEQQTESHMKAEVFS